MCSDKEIIKDTLRQILEAIEELRAWNSSIKCSDDYLLSSDGKMRLAASSMLLEAIGEGINKVNKLRPDLLSQKPDIAWRAIIGMRHHIAHGYFDIDTDIVYDAITHELEPLGEAIRFLSARIS